MVRCRLLKQIFLLVVLLHTLLFIGPHIVFHLDEVRKGSGGDLQKGRKEQDFFWLDIFRLGVFQSI